MSPTLESIYRFLFEKGENEDLLAYPNLPLTGSVASIVLVNLSYLGFVYKLGPWLMKNREPLNLRKVIMAYNALQVAACSILVVLGFYILFLSGHHDFGCVLRLPIDHPLKTVELYTIYMGYLTKYLDYCDTIFFVLRKSYRQVTFLHVYHHLMVSLILYVYIRNYGFGGHIISLGIFNAFVHVVMYYYYFVSANRPEMKKSISWKRHITELQLVQFVIILMHQMYPIVIRTDCTYPKKWLALSNAQAFIFLILFGKFYNKTYLSKKSKSKDGSKGELEKKAN